ncbi:MAG: hypothetical protein WCA78_06960 [Rhizomicrobium sp.]|jgi:hypothetical protein
MQISAANLLVASQQGAKAAPAAHPNGAFAATLAKEEPGFEPLSFKQAVAQPAPQGASAKPAALPTALVPLGSQVDIRV